MNNKKIDWLVLTFLAKKWIRAGCFLCCPSQSTTGRMCSPPLSSASWALQKCLREPGNKLPPTTNLAILPRASTFNLSFSTFLFDGQALWVRLCLKEHFADWKLLQVAALALTVSLKESDGTHATSLWLINHSVRAVLASGSSRIALMIRMHLDRRCLWHCGPRCPSPWQWWETENQLLNSHSYTWNYLRFILGASG